MIHYSNAVLSLFLKPTVLRLVHFIMLFYRKFLVWRKRWRSKCICLSLILKHIHKTKDEKCYEVHVKLDICTVQLDMYFVKRSKVRIFSLLHVVKRSKFRILLSLEES